MPLTYVLAFLTVAPERANPAGLRVGVEHRFLMSPYIRCIGDRGREGARLSINHHKTNPQREAAIFLTGRAIRPRRCIEIYDLPSGFRWSHAEAPQDFTVGPRSNMLGPL